MDKTNAGKIQPPFTAAEAAKALNVKVYTIGVGIPGNAPMPVYDISATSTYGHGGRHR